MYSQWVNELKQLTDRIATIRRQLHLALVDRGNPSYHLSSAGLNYSTELVNFTVIISGHTSQ